MDPLINKINELVRHIETLTEQLEISDEIIDTIFEDTDEYLSEEVLSEEKEKKKKWIQDAIKKPGALHKSLKVKSDKNIPVGKLEKAAKKGGKLGKRARLALTLRKLNK
jgi:division protein CdvB (Snf7/Vps24/ESCRT-III family)